MEETKAYCCECKHFCIGVGYMEADYCESPQLGIVTNYIYGDGARRISVGHPDYPNDENTNGCPYFEPYEIPWKMTFYITAILSLIGVLLFIFA